jgi:hypothetical protein
MMKNSIYHLSSPSHALKIRVHVSIMILLLVIISLSFPVSAVYLVAVEPNPPGADNVGSNLQNYEWVSIFNPSSTPINISGWYVLDEGGSTVCTIPNGIFLCPKAFYKCINKGSAVLSNTAGENVTLYDSLGNPVSSASTPGGLLDTANDEQIWWNSSGTWVFGNYLGRTGNWTNMTGKVWSTKLGNFYDADLYLFRYTCYQRSVAGSVLKGVKDMLADAKIRINKSGTYVWLNQSLNSTQVHYNVHFEGGEDIGFIPPYMLADLSEPKRRATIFEEYYIHLPVEGMQLTGWNIGNYWLLSGIAAKETNGTLFKSWEFYVLFFRTPGATFGPPPAGTDYLNLTKKMIYYRTKIIEDVWRAMEINGIWDTFWNNVGSYLNSYVKIWSAVRNLITSYIP